MKKVKLGENCNCKKTMSDERKMSSLEGWVRAASRKMKNVKKKEKSKEGCKNNWRV